MNKLRALILSIVLMLSIMFFSGCAFITIDDGTYFEGMTVVFNSPTEAEIDFVVEVDAFNTQSRRYTYLFNKTAQYFKIEGDTLEDVNYVQLNETYILITFYVVSDWQFSGDRLVDNDGIRGLFFADVTDTFINPFHEYGNSPYYRLLKDANGANSQASLMVALGSRNNLDGAQLKNRNGINYACWSQSTQVAPDYMFTCSYTAMVSVGWFIVAMLAGILTVGLIILLAKKQGAMVNNPALRQNSYTQENVINQFNLDDQNQQPKPDVFTDFPD